MASIHVRQQHKRKIYWTYTENFLSVHLLLAMISIKYHFVREQVNSNNIMLKHCQTSEMIADMDWEK